MKSLCLESLKLYTLFIFWSSSCRGLPPSPFFLSLGHSKWSLCEGDIFDSVHQYMSLSPKSLHTDFCPNPCLCRWLLCLRAFQQ